MSQSKRPLIRMCRMLKSRVSVLFVSCFVNLWILRADSHSIHAVLCNYTICFQLLQLLKVWGWSWRILKGVARTLWSSLLRNLKAKKKKIHGINSLASGRALESMQTQHFQSDYLKPHFFSISNLTVLPLQFHVSFYSLTAAGWHPSKPSLRGEKQHIPSVNTSYNIDDILKNTIIQSKEAFVWLIAVTGSSFVLYSHARFPSKHGHLF